MMEEKSMKELNKSTKKTPLSDIRTSKLGYEFDVYGTHWQLDNSLKINWGLVDELALEDSCEMGFRKALAVYASEVSGNPHSETAL